MDVFSEAIGTLRTGRAKFARTRQLGAWGNRFGPEPGARRGPAGPARPAARLRAARLAAGGGVPASEDAALASVARRVGYASEFAFANAFKRRFGVSPGRFRRIRRQEPVQHDYDLAGVNTG
ncbi:helix-turn-helix domain-containing protein [Catenuloplanes indicus]|uniref:AraC-like DNA-binding protein n=1 Tax=Catenuloplanes indicus TaxID=137267 RepID=A0AAE3VXC7_9ACTN|nr:AraC-like DNA-binding protein [Catenuloplanes indicus]